MPDIVATERAPRRAARWIGSSAIWGGVVALLGCVLMAAPAAAQLSPPGLGPARTASWSAVGIRQDLDAIRRRESVTYVGVGSISNPDNANPWQKPAIFVLNQEFYDQFHKNWVYSAALSYRRQNEYEDEPPFADAHPSYKHELRFYGRLSYVQKLARFKFVNTFRPELRNFFSPDLGSQEFVQFRFRLRTQVTANLDKNAVHRLVGSAEVLATVGKAHAPAGWTDFDYRESRFCLYYSLRMQSWPVVVDIGYMNNLLGSSHPIDVHYLAIDLVWENPFGKPERGKQQRPPEYLQ
jgi:hypothetical protein